MTRFEAKERLVQRYKWQLLTWSLTAWENAISQLIQQHEDRKL